MSSLSLKKSKSVFDDPTCVEMTKTEFVKHLKDSILVGGELSWITTDTKSFEWTDINEDVNVFLKNLKKFKFEIVDVGLFNPKTKKTKYATYKIV